MPSMADRGGVRGALSGGRPSAGGIGAGRRGGGGARGRDFANIGVGGLGAQPVAPVNTFAKNVTLPTAEQMPFFPGMAQGGGLGVDDPLSAGTSRNHKFRWNAKEQRVIVA